MTDRSRKLSYENAGYITGKMVNDFSPRKTMIVLVIVVGCFAVLWPKVFYPMLVGSANNKIKPSAIDRTQGCCDVIYEKDVMTLKLMSEICSTIIKNDEDKPLSNKQLLQKCQNLVLDTCGIDISAVLQEQVRLGHTTRQILDEVRSLNGSLCLKYNFGVAPWKLGVPHRITVKVSPSSSIRQERPLHLRSEMVHPAFRERGRAIPQTEFAPTKPAVPSRPTPKIVEGRPGPIPGMRPTLGGAGHVVPPPKQGGTSMGLIMPIYTVGIVIFFTYTVMKIVFNKQPEVLYPPINPDPHFRREVFEADRGHLGSRSKDSTSSSKLVVNAMSALLDEVDLELSSRRKASEAAQDVANGSLVNQDEDQSSVQVLGMETTASRENGQKWTRSGSPVPPTVHPHPSDTPPQEIFLEGSLPPQSHLLVTDSATEAQKIDAEEDPAVVLAGKMTLSVISLDSSENGTEESSGSGKKNEERSSSNVSEEFEKIDVAQLEEQIGDIIAEAENSNLDEYKHIEGLLFRDSERTKDFINREAEECLQQAIDESTDIIHKDDVLKEVNTDDTLYFLIDENKIAAHSEDNIKNESNLVKEENEPTVEQGTCLIENLIEESVDAVVGTIQDKQKELDTLLLKTEKDLAQTTDFFDSKIDQIQKDLALIEKQQGSLQIQELDVTKTEPSQEDITKDTSEDNTKQPVSIDSKTSFVEELQVKSSIEDIQSIKEELTDKDKEITANIGTTAESSENKDNIKEIIDDIKEELIIEELIIPSDKSSSTTVDDNISDTKKESGKNIESKVTISTEEETQKHPVKSISLTESNEHDSDIKQEKTDVTDKNKDTIIDNTTASKEVEESSELKDEMYILESDNEEDQIGTEPNKDKVDVTESQLEEAVLLDKEDDEDQQDYDEEYDEDDDEEGEELDQEIVEYISDEEEEEVEEEEIDEEEEEEDADEEDEEEDLEDEKVISHV